LDGAPPVFGSATVVGDVAGAAVAVLTGVGVADGDGVAVATTIVPSISLV
jgi:hypothetical protein